MKKIFLIVLLFISLFTQAQRVTDLQTYTGPSDSAYTVIVIPGQNGSFSTRKAFGRDLAKSIIDSLRSALDAKIGNDITINGHPITSNIEITKAEVGLSQVQNFNAADMPISTATNAALSVKANSVNPVFPNDIFVPNGAADATTADSAAIIDRITGKVVMRPLPAAGSTEWGDLEGDINDAIDLITALNLKVPTSRTVNGKALSSNISIDKTDVGLGNADNTSDANKPVSTAQAVAIGLKADASHTHTVTQVTNGVQLSVLASNVSNSTTSYADVTALSFPVTATKIYWFRFMISYTAAATTTGTRWSINGPGGGTVLRYRSSYTLDGSTFVQNEGMASYNSPASASVSSLLVGNYAFIEGIIVAGATGDVIARFASEVASSQITAAKDFSFVQWQQLN